jgi:hypothetical protein
MLASPWMTPGGRTNSIPAYRARIWASIAVRKARSCGPSQVFVSIRWRAFENGDRSGKVQVGGGGELVQLDQDLGDLGDAGVLVPVVGDGVPEGNHVAAGHDGLVDVHHADRRIADGLQPPGDRHGPADITGVSAGARHPGDDGCRQPVDRVGADPQEACTCGVDPGDRAGPLEDVLGLVHPCGDRRGPAGMRTR